MSCSVVLHSECCLNIIESEIAKALPEISSLSYLIGGVLKLMTECAKNPTNVECSFVTSTLVHVL